MRRPLFAIATIALLFSGCGKHATEPPPAATGPGGLPPGIIATQPAPRSPSAAYDGEIWAQFDRPLDSRTVTALTVYLKLDGQRITSTISYDGITRRIFVRPGSTLQLQRTYTVEFSTAVKGLDGVPLPQGVFFQFTTNSLRRLAYDYPVAGALEGPTSALGWGGTQALDGNIFYEVYAGTDSAAVASRSTSVLQRSVFTRFLPSTEWPAGARVYWAVTSENLTTKEREDGPVRSFLVMDGTAVLDSVIVRGADHGSADIRNRNVQSCNSVTLPCGPSFNGCIHWNFGTVPANVRFASATIKLWTTDINANTFGRTQPAVWMAQNDWSPCAVVSPGPPFIEQSGFLASAVPTSSIEAHFDSARLTAFCEALYRRRTLLFGTLFRTQENVSFHSTLATDPTRIPVMVVRFYRLPPGVQD
jgi:hypothetical protein